MVVRGLEQQTIISVPVAELKTAWKKTFWGFDLKPEDRKQMTDAR